MTTSFLSLPLLSALRDHGCMIRRVSKQVNMIENDGGLGGMTLPIYEINDIE